jgi:nicotinamidase-related amidase
VNVRHDNVLAPEHTAIVVVDLQDAFRAPIFEFDKIVARTAIVLQAAKLLNLPVLVTEQYPQKLGATVPEIKALLPDGTPVVDKTAFSCCGASVFNEQLERLRRTQIVLCGIETHVCMSQTAHDLLARGRQVHVLEDCTSSRAPQNREIGLAKMRRSGALPSSSEMALFELMQDARHEHFRAISKLVK